MIQSEFTATTGYNAKGTRLNSSVNQCSFGDMTSIRWYSHLGEGHPVILNIYKMRNASRHIITVYMYNNITLINTVTTHLHHGSIIALNDRLVIFIKIQTYVIQNPLFRWGLGIDVFG